MNTEASTGVDLELATKLPIKCKVTQRLDGALSNDFCLVPTSVLLKV